MMGAPLEVSPKQRRIDCCAAGCERPAANTLTSACVTKLAPASVDHIIETWAEMSLRGPWRTSRWRPTNVRFRGQSGHGFHVMLVDLEHPLEQGQTVKATLKFDCRYGRCGISDRGDRCARTRRGGGRRQHDDARPWRRDEDGQALTTELTACWFAALTILVLLEKVIPSSRIITRLGGLAFIVVADGS